MPPRLPERYQFEVRLGRDGDVEEWLATDTALDRPVLIRILGPETSKERQAEFFEAVRGASSATHTHLASIFAADRLPDGAYSVSEWAGGITLEHRKEAGDTMPVQEFLPNAAGLAEALAALHERGILHGSIDDKSIFFSLAHPAKLAGFGRHAEGASASKDVRDLAATLTTAVTGSASYDVAPSQMVDGLSSGVDRILSRARAGDLDAAGLAELLRAAPSSTLPGAMPERTISWRWVIPAVVMLGTAIVLFLVGRSLNTGSQDPLMFPVTPGSSIAATATTTTTTEQVGTPSSSVSVTDVRIFDPEGDGAEHDLEIPNLTDGTTSTSWTTERYNNPLPLIKRGVGFALEVDGTPTGVELLGSTDGMSYRLLWARTFGETIDDWEPVASGSIRAGRGSIQLPGKAGGFWLVWITDLPADPEGGYVGGISEVRFLP